MEFLRRAVNALGERINGIDKSSRVSFEKEMARYRAEYEQHIATNPLAFNPCSTAHPDQMRLHGLRVTDIRQTTGLSPEEVVARIGSSTNFAHYTAFEMGLIPPGQISDEFLRKYSTVMTGALKQTDPTLRLNGLSGDSPEIA